MTVPRGPRAPKIPMSLDKGQSSRVTAVPPALNAHKLTPAVVREHREIYIRGYVAGLAAPVRRRRARIAAVAVVLATIALVLTAFWAGHVTAAPRPAPVIPSSAAPAVTGERASSTALSSDPERTEAPHPTGVIDDAGATGTNPDLTPEPTPKPLQKAINPSSGGVSGPATWFAQAPYGTAAAGPRLRRYLGDDWRGSRVSVSLRGCGCPPVVLVLTDWCACTPPGGPDRIIDLDDAAFAALAPLSVGVITVEVKEVAP